MPKALIVKTAFATEAKARAVAEKLLRERIVACAGVFPMQSVYWWKEKIRRQREFSLELKTAPRVKQLLLKRLGELHDFETPFIAFCEEGVNAKAAKWLEEETSVKRKGEC